LESFITQLKQRQIFKVATIYAVSTWPLIQISDLAVPALGLPDSVMTLLLKVFVIGFPISLVFAWLFNFTTDGISFASEDAAQGSESGKASKQNDENGTASKINVRTTLTVVSTLVLALIITLASQMMIEEDPIIIPQQTAVIEKPATPTLAGKAINTNTLSAGKKESIAILPFISFSSDPQDQFFADGMVEELLNLMARIPDLQVAARTSSFSYKGVTNKTIVKIGQELGVDTILQGSIRKNDVTNKIRITAQLVKVSTGENLWSETYDREYRDIFQIQDDIASAVVDKMKVTLLGSPQESNFVVGTHSVDAMVEYGKGQNELAHRTIPSINKALVHFQNAIKADGNYARAYVGVANAYILQTVYSSLPSKEVELAAQQALDKALEINPLLGEAYASQGLLLSPTNKESAELAFQKAIELTPNYAMAYMWYGSLVQMSGDVGGAHQLYEKAFELDPKSPIAAYNVAWCYYKVGDEGKAMDLFSTIINNDPYYPGAYNLAGDVLFNRGRLDEAIPMYYRALELDAENQVAVRGLLLANIDMGNIAHAEQWFDYLEQKPTLFTGSEVVFFKARFFAAQGEKQKALSYLEKVNFEEHDMGMNLLIQAEIAFYKSNYVKAINAYEELFSAKGSTQKSFFYMSDGHAALHLASAYLEVEQNTKATELLNNFENYLQEGTSKKASHPSFYYQMAMIKVLQKNNVEGFNYLQGAIDAGWVQVWRASYEPIFDTIRESDRYSKMMGGVEAKLDNMRIRMTEHDDFLVAEQ
jgi:TolB-like protein/tetratricopeptide (TPR) repeat protein